MVRLGSAGHGKTWLSSAGQGFFPPRSDFRSTRSWTERRVSDPSGNTIRVVYEDRGSGQSPDVPGKTGAEFQGRGCITLVLTRRELERIYCDLPDGRSIVFTLLEIDRGKVRVGIDAPDDVLIVREEVRRPRPSGGVLPIPHGEAPKDTYHP